MTRFKDKVALITGGGTGIGRATAKAIVAEGGKAVITGRREQPLKALADEHPDSIRYVSADVSSADGPAKAVAFTVEQFGQIDILINNAGVAHMGPLLHTDDRAIDRAFDINVKGVLRLSREAAPHLQTTRGNVVTISSIVGDAAIPNAAAYAGSKAAVQQITRVLAAEFGPTGVRFNAVAPGYTVTDMSAGLSDEVQQAMIAQTPMGRAGTPEDIAKAIVFLASDDASWITGQTLQSSGGLLL